ncbi:MAG: portal protein, partial [Candidatus Thalassarchaeaceae archaeon]|nr:portal protein [Candidatus Thalassarchaeaceae archaeon]
NNLASALLLTLLPPNDPFFRLVVDKQTLAELEAEAGGEDLKTEIESALSRIEQAVLQEIETQSLSVSTYEAVRHLIVTGNALLHLHKDGGMRVIHLDRYVVKRDGMGNVKTVVIKETLTKESLPDEAAACCVGESAPNPGSSDGIDLYTCMHVNADGSAEVYQEINGQVVPKSEGKYKEGEIPFLALRMNKTSGEDYGRGYVEQYIGDLKSLESLMMSIVEASAAAAKVMFLVAPNGVTRSRVLAEAPNGAIVEGNASDVSVLQVQKSADLQITFQAATTIQDRLSYAFLLTDSSIRNAERVTAAEIRLVSQSIERQLGGIYSVLSVEFQLPLISKLMKQMEKNGKLPKMPKDLVTPTVVTGMSALGRGSDLNKMDEFLVGVGQILGPEILSQYVDIREYMDRRALALGIDTDGLVKTEEQLQAEQQQAMMQQMAAQMGPAAIQGISDMGTETIKQAGQPMPAEE